LPLVSGGFRGFGSRGPVHDQISSPKSGRPAVLPLLARSGTPIERRQWRPVVTEKSMNAALESGWLLRWYLIGVVGSAVLLTASPANGDVGVTAVSPRIGSPGQPVELEVGCGGGCGPQLSISLVPRSRAPTYLPCDRRDRARARRAGHVIPKGAVCAPTSRQLPRKPPYVFLGWAKGTNLSSSVTRYRLGFRVPRVRPGAYKFVIWRPPGEA
jgi:hypothetical protein